MNLADALLDREQEPGARLAYGVVVSATPLTVRVGAGTSATDAKALAAYTPTVGDYVAVLINGADRLVLGDIA